MMQTAIGESGSTQPVRPASGHRRALSFGEALGIYAQTYVEPDLLVHWEDGCGDVAPERSTSEWTAALGGVVGRVRTWLDSLTHLVARDQGLILWPERPLTACLGRVRRRFGWERAYVSKLLDFRQRSSWALRVKRSWLHRRWRWS